MMIRSKVVLYSLPSGGSIEVAREFTIPGGTEDIRVEGEWLHCFNPTKGESVFFRLPQTVRRIEITYG